MREDYNIQNIENFINNSIIIEVSDISKIIKKILSFKNDKKYIQRISNKPYDILEKIKFNEFTKNYSIKIKKYHISDYDIIEDVISQIEKYDILVREDLYTFYWNIYMGSLSKMGIDYDNDVKIKNNSDAIYNNIVTELINQLFVGKQSDIPQNKIVIYTEAITAYVFYKCKILLPIDQE